MLSECGQVSVPSITVVSKSPHTTNREIRGIETVNLNLRTHLYRRVPVFVVFVLLTVISIAPFGQEEAPVQKPQHYMIELLGTRERWPENMTADEERIMSEHYLYLKDLTARGKVLMAGPVFGRFGLIVLEVGSKDEAKAIMAEEPSVVQGVHTYEMYPMVASLMASNVPSFRYVEQPTDKVLRKEVTVSAPLSDVWTCWTTTAGVEGFVAPKAKIDLRIGGPYEWYFATEAPPGEQGSEDCRVLSFLPMEMLSFEWNAPPSFGWRRYIKTRVVVQFHELEPGVVKVTLSQLGWGEGAEWQEVYDYFDSAWGYVLDALKKHFES